MRSDYEPGSSKDREREREKKFPRTDKDELLARMGQQQVHKLSATSVKSGNTRGKELKYSTGRK